MLLRNTDTSKLEDRDAQEVVGYFQVLDLISESYADIDISENSLKGLHNHLLRFSRQDDWHRHRGNYKQHSNAVEASLPDGTRHVIFQTTAPGFATEDAMRELVAWYHRDQVTHPLVKCALFAYDFVSIHPFQDGNGRLSRLLATLLLLRHGYVWIQYVSLEHEIENRKTEYYRVLQQCQAQRPGENVSAWLAFFFDALLHVQQQLLQKLTVQEGATQLSPREKAVLGFIGTIRAASPARLPKNSLFQGRPSNVLWPSYWRRAELKSKATARLRFTTWCKAKVLAATVASRPRAAQVPNIQAAHASPATPEAESCGPARAGR